MSPIVRAAKTVREKVHTNRYLLTYIAVVVTIIAYMTYAARYQPNWP